VAIDMEVAGGYVRGRWQKGGLVIVLMAVPRYGKCRLLPKKVAGGGVAPFST